MNDGTITLSFSETVDAATLNPDEITLQTAGAGTGSSFHLTGGTASTAGSDVAAIVIDVAEADLHDIKLLYPLGFNQTYISYSSELVLDRAVPANQVAPVVPIASFPANVLVPDATKPLLLAFDIDLATDSLTLKFNEPIRAASCNPTDFVLQDQRVAAVSVALVNSAVRTGSPDGLQIYIDIGFDDANAIKLLPGLATSGANSYLSVSQTGAQDMAHNQLVPITDAESLQVSIFVADNIGPTVTSFEFDLEKATITISFSEAVRASTFDATLVGLQDSAKAYIAAGEASPMNGLHLTQSTTQSLDGAVIVIDIFHCDLNAIKTKRGLARSSADTYLIMDEGAIKDLNGNAVAAIPDGSALKAKSFNNDQGAPTLQSWSMSMSPAGPPLSLHLKFDEVVDLNLFDVTKVQLQSDQTRIGTTKYVRLSGGNVTNGDNCCSYM